MSYPQPGPYGQQPGPYGTPPPQGPPPYGAGQPGYGQPRWPGPYAPPGQQPGQQPGQVPGQFPGQPTAQQPGFAGPPPYGAPAPTPPPGGGGGRRRTPLIALAIAVALALVGTTAYLLLGGEDDPSIAADDGTRYTIELPEASGEFRKFGDSGGGPSSEELAQAGLGEMESDDALYRNLDPSAWQAAEGEVPPGTVTLGVLGLWGEVEDPERSVDAVFALAAAQALQQQTRQQQEQDAGPEYEMVGSPSNFTDTDAVIKCQIGRGVRQDPDLGYVPESTVCVWADYSTMGLLYFSPLPIQPGGSNPHDPHDPDARDPQDASGIGVPEPMPVAEAADHTRQLRQDSIRPVDEGGGSGG